MEMLLAPLRQPLEVTRQALVCCGGLCLQRTRLVQVLLEKGGGAGMLMLITPLSVEIHADNRERSSGEFG
jgi:hypothetical protein